MINIPVSRDFIIEAIEFGIARSSRLSEYNAVKLRAVAQEMDRVLFGSWSNLFGCGCPIVKARIDRNDPGARLFAAEFDAFCLRRRDVDELAVRIGRLVVTT